jgi:hypothetical protein
VLELPVSDESASNCSLQYFPKYQIGRVYLQQMSAYAVIVGTPAALTSEVKATGEGRIVQSRSAAVASITVVAFFGSFLSETVEIQPENGRTPSRATAQIKREAATPATVVF